jgi:phosphatidylinositol-4,5-bisphosphate 3-kinase
MSINEFNENKDLEVMTFRRHVLGVCKLAVEERELRGQLGQARYVYPPDIHHSAELPPHILERVNKGSTSLFTVDIFFYIAVLQKTKGRSSFAFGW